MIWSISDIMKSILELDPIFKAIRKVISLSRHNAPAGWGSNDWSQYYKAKMDDNPQYALIVAWGILEKEAKQEFGSALRNSGEGRNASICNNAADRVGMNSSEKRKLKSAMKKRNQAAHGERVDIFWSDVDIVIDVAYRLHQLH